MGYCEIENITIGLRKKFANIFLLTHAFVVSQFSTLKLKILKIKHNIFQFKGYAILRCNFLYVIAYGDDVFDTRFAIGFVLTETIAEMVAFWASGE